MSIITESMTFDLIAILTTIVGGVILYYKWKLSYWDKLGIPTIPPTIFFGNTKDLILGRLSFGEQFHVLYKQLKNKGYKRHGGIYFGTMPFYMTISPEMVKNVLQNDFQYFVNRSTFINEKDDPLSGNLINLQNEKWKNMRVKLTPTFTSGKMRMMFQTLVGCSVGLKDILDDASTNHIPVDIKEILARFTTDIIGSTAFGIDCNSLKDPNTLFRKYGRRVIELNTVLDRIKFLIQFIVPQNILCALKFKLTPSDAEKFFMDLARDTVDYREKNNIYRKDFMHLLIQLKNRGTVTDDHKITDEQGNFTEKALTMNELSAQVFSFFVAGFETSSTTMTFALYELAVNPNIQEKLREEINTVLRMHNNELTYDAIMEMAYMDKVLQETLRKHPPIPDVSRKTTKDYKIPNTNIVLEKGTDVLIPIKSIHLDPEYYPNPHKFDPERFSEENKKTRPPFTWIPFGEGPRVCIGLRFAMMQSKVGLATILQNFKIKLNQKTTSPLKYDKTSFITAADGGVWLNVEKIN